MPEEGVLKKRERPSNEPRVKDGRGVEQTSLTTEDVQEEGLPKKRGRRGKEPVAEDSQGVQQTGLKSEDVEVSKTKERASNATAAATGEYATPHKT